MITKTIKDEIPSGNVAYIKQGDKITATFNAPLQPVLPEPKCTLCVDGQITDTYGKMYPCECQLGDKWTGFLEPNYTGPVILKPKTSKSTSPVVNITDYKEYTKVTTVNVPKYQPTTLNVPKYENLYKWIETANDLKLQYGEASKEVYENVTGLPFEPKEPTVTVKEVEQPTGRRFKEKI